MAKDRFGNLVKAVVDTAKEIMAVDGELHADQERLLLDRGSKQQDLWGINLYPEKYGDDDFVEFDSMINLKPGQNNLSRGVDDKKIRARIVKIVNRLVEK
ncbi:TPA: hypothetical protein DEQ95_02320 [Candidatus Beckwithbacteria bacterium]|nr:hypothetical protein [Candidatus Beckwithbacteria bacterium]HAV66397.1 hypothetical protein [Candidatus Beckwithbacteria bacterium]HCE99659.1 hypothetical protein [Candidatus Beckwithbacteria bacterium]HCM44733.1 hypothetical protein [Candidatus Beckwithbacteria bacterium]HCQ92413.1 hypothetical protein [Candidatus Beckwithbacteria bacterium]